MSHRSKGSHAAVDIGGVLYGGRELEIRQTVGLPDFEDFSFPKRADVALTVRSTGGALEITGTLDTTVAGACARCLDAVEFTLHLDVDERFLPDGEDPLREGNVVLGDHFDVADFVRQQVDSGLPLVMTCSDACPGLCPDCGGKRDGTCCCTPS